MKRITFLAMCALLMTALTLVLNCSNPLEITDPADLDPPQPVIIYDTVFDTLYDNDTIYQIDTTYIVDTLYDTDTITITDTVKTVDTVVIVEPGTEAPQTVCSILLSNLYEIIWMFQNQEGQYTLTFTAEAARDFTFRTLTVDVDGEQFTWCPSENPEIVREQYLNAFASIRIMTDQPCLQGHEVDICLTISKP